MSNKFRAAFAALLVLSSIAWAPASQAALQVITLTGAVSGSGIDTIATTLASGLTLPSPSITGTLTLPDGETWTSIGLSGPLNINTTGTFGALLNVSGNVSFNRGAGFMSEGAYFRGGGGTITNTGSSGFYNDNFAINSWNSAVLDATSATQYDKISTMYCANPPTVNPNVTFNTSYCFYVAGGKLGIFSSASNNGTGGLIISTPQTIPFWGVTSPVEAITAFGLTDNTVYNGSGSNAAGALAGGLSIGVPTINGNGCTGSCTGVLYSSISTVYISGPPVTGTGPVGTTIGASNLYALNVNQGTARFGGTVRIAGNASAPAWAANGIELSIPAATETDTSSTAGTVANDYINSFGQVTVAASNSGVTYTTNCTVCIIGPPIASGVTMTNIYSLLVVAGLTDLAGGLTTTTLQATGVPTSGTAAGSACFDSAGNIFKKTTTGACL